MPMTLWYIFVVPSRIPNGIEPYIILDIQYSTVSSYHKEESRNLYHSIKKAKENAKPVNILSILVLEFLIFSIL